MCTVIMIFLVIVFGVGFLGDIMENRMPKTFTYGNYSIKLTSSFEDYDGEWDNSDSTVYCFDETSEELSKNGYTYDSAAEYLKNKNLSYGIDSTVTSVSDTSAWVAYTNTYDGNEYYNYDYVIEVDGVFWYTEFYCLAEDADKYTPLFKKWAQSIVVSNFH